MCKRLETLQRGARDSSVPDVIRGLPATKRLRLTESAPTQSSHRDHQFEGFSWRTSRQTLYPYTARMRRPVRAMAPWSATRSARRIYAMRTAIRAALAALALSASAFAQAISVIPDPVVPGQYSATFEGTHTSAGNFADRYDFGSPVDGAISITLDSTSVGVLSVAFQGYQLTSGPLVFLGGTSHETIGPLPIRVGPQLLTIGLQAAPPLAPDSPALTSYTGQIIINALPIPEPETWSVDDCGAVGA